MDTYEASESRPHYVSAPGPVSRVFLDCQRKKYDEKGTSDNVRVSAGEFGWRQPCHQVSYARPGRFRTLTRHYIAFAPSLIAFELHLRKSADVFLNGRRESYDKEGGIRQEFASPQGISERRLNSSSVTGRKRKDWTLTRHYIAFIPRLSPLDYISAS